MAHKLIWCDDICTQTCLETGKCRPVINGKEAFIMWDRYGFPLELLVEELQQPKWVEARRMLILGHHLGLVGPGKEEANDKRNL